MNYLISTFDCFIVSNKIFEIKQYAKYQINFGENEKAICFSKRHMVPFVLDFDNKGNVQMTTFILSFQIIFQTFFPLVLILRTRR